MQTPGPEFSLISEILRAGVTIACVAVGGYISARVTFASLERNAKRAENLEQAKQKRDALLTRLSMQRECHQEFLALFAKHQAVEPTSSLSGMAASFQRDKEAANAAHHDSVVLYGKLSLAFGSADFAAQASMVLEMLVAVKRRPAERTLAELWGNRFSEGMRKAIEATERQLDLPAFGEVPAPLFPPDQLNKMLKQAHLHELADAYGVDRARVDALLEAAEKERAAAKSPEDTAG